MFFVQLFRPKLKAAGLHILCSVLVAACVALLVFVLWYPEPYRVLSGGTQLFQMIVGIDVVAGPMLTFLVFNPQKTWRALAVDLGVIAVLQATALGYGLWVVFEARPVHLVFDGRLLRVVHASDVLQPEGAPPVPLPLVGPELVALRLPEDSKQRSDLLVATLNSGVFEAYRAALWVPYASARVQVLQQAVTPETVAERHPQSAELMRRALARVGIGIQDVVCLPVVGREYLTWTALLDKRSALPVAYIPIDMS